MAIRCEHGMMRGLCVVVTCAHSDGGRTPCAGEDGSPRAYNRRPAQANETRGDASRFHHPGFKDLTGQRFGQLVVESRAPNVNGTARWRCVCDCGGRTIITGIALRAGVKNGHVSRCPDCRPKRSGTVTRRVGT